MSKHSGTSKFDLLVLLWLSRMKKQSVFSDRQNPWLLDTGRIVNVGANHVMIEISGRENETKAFTERMREFGILEMVRTGRIAMLRDRTITEDSVTDELKEAAASTT